MDDEKLKKSNNLKAEIDAAEKHVKLIAQHLLDDKKDGNSIHIYNGSTSDHLYLKELISPIKANDLLVMYQMKTIAELERLKLEFKNL